jgi:hypothetical protein
VLAHEIGHQLVRAEQQQQQQQHCGSRAMRCLTVLCLRVCWRWLSVVSISCHAHPRMGHPCGAN